MKNKNSVSCKGSSFFRLAVLAVLFVPVLSRAEIPFDWQPGNAPDGVETSLFTAYGNGRVVIGHQIAGMSPDVLITTTADGGQTWETNTLYVHTNQHHTPEVLAFANDKFFIFVQRGGQTLSAQSTDGITWESLDVGGMGISTGFAYGNGRYIAVGSAGGLGVIRISVDGETWPLTMMDESQMGGIQHIAFGSGVFVIATSRSGSMDQRPTLFYSTDGEEWTAAALDSEEDIGAISQLTYGNGVFMATSGSSVMVSDDGQTWSKSSQTLNVSSTQQVLAEDGVFLVVGQRQTPSVFGSDRPVLYYSLDGDSWIDDDLEDFNNHWLRIAYTGEGWIGMLHHRFSSSEEPFLVFTTDGSGSGGSPSYEWLGTWTSLGSGWVYHEEHGYLYHLADPLGGLYLWDPVLGWLWTMEGFYPIMHRVQPAGWVFYHLGGSPQRRLFTDLSTQELIIVP